MPQLTDEQQILNEMINDPAYTAPPGAEDSEGSQSHTTTKNQIDALKGCKDIDPSILEAVIHRLEDKSQIIKLIEAMQNEADLQLWLSTDADNIYYMTYRNRNGFLEHERVEIEDNSNSLELLMQLLWRAEQVSITQQTAQRAVNQIASNAKYGNSPPLPVYPIHVRSASYNGNIYLDTCNSRREIIEISPWQKHPRVLPQAEAEQLPFKFIQHPFMLALPDPDFDGHIDELKGFVNASDENTFARIKASMVDAAKGNGDYFITAYQGEYGTWKTSTAVNSMRVFDPNAQEPKGLPSDESKIALVGSQKLVSVFDNISYINNDQSDNLSRIATGTSESGRELYAKRRVQNLNLNFPIVITSIPDVGNNPDFLDRMLKIPLSLRTDSQEPEEVKDKFTEHHPRLLGGLLNYLHKGLQHLDEAKNGDFTRHRMIAGSNLAIACEIGAGGTGKITSEVFKQSREDGEDHTEDHPIVMGIRKLMSGHKVWKAPNQKLYNDVKLLLGEDAKTREWPDSALSFSKKLPIYYGVLRKQGIEITKHKSGSRSVEITNSKYDGSDSTMDGSNGKPSYVAQIQADGSDGSSSTFHQDEVVKRLDSRTNNSKDVP